MESFPYEPLDFMKYEFGLLTLDEVDNEAGDSVIRASLRLATMIEPPVYRALSYCWGDPTVTGPIIINSTFTV